MKGGGNTLIILLLNCSRFLMMQGYSGTPWVISLATLTRRVTPCGSGHRATVQTRLFLPATVVAKLINSCLNFCRALL